MTNLYTLEGAWPAGPFGNGEYRASDSFREQDFATLEGFFSGLIRTAVAPFKAIGHTAGEIGRGIRDGDIGRVALAPVRGIGHQVGETVRGTRDTIEGVVKPSEAKKEMGILASVLGVGALVFTGPFAVPILGGLAAAAGTWGGLANKIDAQSKVAEQTQRLDLGTAPYGGLQPDATKIEEKKMQTATKVALVGVLGGLGIYALS